MNAAPLLLALAALLDVAANALLKRSDGFKHMRFGLGALLLIVTAFWLLGQSLQALPLATAYATWGGCGIILTALLSRKLDGTRLDHRAWLGLGLILTSLVVLHLTH